MSSPSQFKVQSTSHQRISFAAGTTDPSNNGYRPSKYLPPSRLVAPSGSSSQHQQSSSSSIGDDQDVGTLKHFSYSCPGLTDGTAGSSPTHVEAVPFAFLFGLPPDEQIEKQKEYDEESRKKSDPFMKGSGWKSERSMKDLLLATERQIVIPLYQRTYTWIASTQGVKWFDDMTAKFGQLYNTPSGRLEDETKRVLVRHGTGKIVMRKFVENNVDDHDENKSGAQRQQQLQTQEDAALVTANSSSSSSSSTSPWMCVDGQQRATTASLLFAAIFAVGVCDILENQQDFSNNNDKEFEEAKNYFLSLIHQMIFVDVEAARRWVRVKRSEYEEFITIRKNNKQRQQQDTTDEDIEAEFWFREGVRIPGARLVPSHVDRSPFYELMTRQFIRRELLIMRNNHKDQDDDSNSRFNVGISQNFSQSCMKSLQGKMMLELFIPRVRQLVFQKCSASSSPISNENNRTFFLKTLSNLTKHLLHGSGVVLVELVAKDTKIAQVFLWMQEKSLFGMGALLFNPAPGIDFRAMDLVRNLLMAPFMQRSLESQEKAHDDLWLKPIEVPSKKIVAAYNHYVMAASSSNNANSAPPQLLTSDDLTLKFVTAMETEQTREKESILLVEKAKLKKNMASDSDNEKDKKPEIAIFKSRFQDKIEKMVTGDKIIDQTKKNRTTGILLYCRFYSIFEYHLQKLWRKEKQLQQQRRSREEEEEENAYYNDDDDDDNDEQQQQQQKNRRQIRSIEDVEQECCEYLLGRLAEVCCDFVQEVEKKMAL